MISRRRTVVLALVVAASSGCTLRSRWAMNDPAYAAKYAGVKQTPLRKIKEAIDARHVVGGGGYYLAGGASAGAPATSNGTIGFFTYPQPWLSAYGGFTGIGGTADDNGFGGIELGLRAQSPSRVAPFVGVGGTVATSWENWAAFILNTTFSLYDDDEYIKYTGTGFAACYPEAGVHVWLTHKLRLSGSVRYYFADEGDQFWYGGLTLSLFGGGHPDPEHGPYSTREDRLRFREKGLMPGETSPLDGDWYPDLGQPANEPPPPPRPRNPYDNIPVTRPLPPPEPQLGYGG